MFPEKITKEKDNLFSGERELGTRLEEFSNDHINRYNFAQYFIKQSAIVLDAACGVGYGSYLLAERALKVAAIDYDDEAIRYAQTHWAKDNIRYIRGDLLDSNVYPAGQKYNAIVSFETIEHLKDDKGFLRIISGMLLPGGLFFVSAPNAEVLKAEDNPWHERHYTPAEFHDLLASFFRYVTDFTQIDCGVRKGRGGDNNILVCSDKPCRTRVAVFVIHTFLYRLKKKMLGSVRQ